MEQPAIPHNWEWLQKYRVWEANRKIFLYPENWLEPELQKEKSRFYKELEDELLQIDLTKASPIVLAEVIALAQIGMQSCEPKDFENVVNSIVSEKSQDEYKHLIKTSIRKYLHTAIQKVIERGTADHGSCR